MLASAACSAGPLGLLAREECGPKRKLPESEGLGGGATVSSSDGGHAMPKVARRLGGGATVSSSDKCRLVPKAAGWLGGRAAVSHGSRRFAVDSGSKDWLLATLRVGHSVRSGARILF